MFLLHSQELPPSLDGQFHTEAKVFSALQGEWDCFHPPAQCAHPLSSSAIAQHLDTDLPVLVDHLNVTAPRAAVPDNVGHPFAHRPGKRCVYSWWEHLLNGVDLYLDPRGFQELPRSL